MDSQNVKINGINIKDSSATGMLSGSHLEKMIVFCIFTQYDIRPVLKI